METIAGRVRAIDADFYGNDVASDPMVSPCLAEPAPVLRLTTREPERASYRQKLVTTELIAIAAATALAISTHFAVGDSRITPELVGVPVLAYVITAPIVHLAEGQGRNALTSVGLRLGLPAVGAVVGSMLGNASQGNGIGAGLLGASIGAVTGTLAAIAIDWRLLPYVDHTVGATTVGIAAIF